MPVLNALKTLSDAYSDTHSNQYVVLSPYRELNGQIKKDASNEVIGRGSNA